jgi:DNA modification methylase
VACKVTGREFIGIEIDERYFNIAEERLIQPEETTKQTTIFDFWQ